MLNPTGSFLEALLVEGEVLELYPLLGTSTDAQTTANPPMEALISFNNANYHVKFTPEMVPTGEYSVAEEYSDDHLDHIDQWQEQLLKELHIDDKSNAEEGKRVAQMLVDAGVVTVVGHLNSGVSIPAAPIYATKNIPQLAISTKPDYTQLGLPTTFRIVGNDSMQSKALARIFHQVALLCPATLHECSLSWRRVPNPICSERDTPD